MPLWPTRVRAELDAVQAQFATDIVPPISSPDQVASFLSGWGQDVWDTGDFVTEPIMSRAAAISVPAVAAGRDLIVTTLAPLALALFQNGTRVDPPPPLLRSPDPRFTPYEWAAWTLDDLIFEGESIQRVTARGWDKYPTAIERLEPLCFTVTDDGILDECDRPIPPGDLVRFGSGSDGLRWKGRRILRTALRLEQAARQDADTPIPPLALVNNGPDLDPDEVTSLLDTWRAARAATKGGVAYTNSAIEAKPLGWSSSERQLVEARRYVAVEIARMIGLDASDLDAAQAGSSITYQNTVSQNRNRLQRLAGYRAALEQRFSMGDLTPRGYTVRLDTSPLDTDEIATRYAAYATGIAAGFLTPDEVRQGEGLEPLTPTPNGGAP